MSTIEQPHKLYSKFEHGVYNLKSSETHSIPVNLAEKIEKTLEFKIVHSFFRQDHSVRIWISDVPRGQAISWGGRPNYLNLQKKIFDIKIIVSDDKNLYKNRYTFLTKKEMIYFNVQNLENFDNGYKILLPDFCKRPGAKWPR